MGRTLKQLLDAAVFRQEYWQGTATDFGTLKIPMTIVGSPKFNRNGNYVGLQFPVAGSAYTASSALQPPVISDVSAFCGFEMCIVAAPGSAASDAIFYQIAAPGGGTSFWFSTSGAAFGFYVHQNCAGAGNGRYVFTPLASCKPSTTYHALISCTDTFLTNKSWINGIPQTTGLTNFAVPVASSPVVFRAGAYGVISGHMTILLRIWNGGTAFSDDEATILYNASRTLVTG